MRIVASYEIVGGGAGISQPVCIQRRWHHRVPSLPLWTLLLLLLVVPKANRHRQAWLILVPLGLVLIVWRMAATLLGLPDEDVETLGFLVVTGAMAWSMVWLLGHWLGRSNRFVTFFLAVGVMLAVGLLSYRCGYQFDEADDFVSLLPCSALAAILPLAMLLTGCYCRAEYSPGRFRGWLFVWTIASTLGVTLSFMFVAANMTLIVSGLGNTSHGANFSIFVLLFLIPISALVGSLLYLVNLPFLELAFKSPFYRDRFEKLFHVETDPDSDPGWRELLADASSTHPTGNPVTADDLVGRWQFYLDRASSTVRIDFRPDGTFAQTILANQGGFRECPGGTWRLEGALVHLTGYATAAEGISQSRTWWMIDTPTGLALFGGNSPDTQSFFRMQRRRQLLTFADKPEH